MNEIRITLLNVTEKKQHYIRKPLAGKEVDIGSQFEQNSIYTVLRMIAFKIVLEKISIKRY